MFTELKILDIDALQRKFIVGYFAIMTVNLLIYIYLCWPFLINFPFNCFIGILFVANFAGIFLSHKNSYAKIKPVIPAIIALSIISACPLIVLSHVMGNMTIYIWFIVAPASIFVIYPEIKLNQALILLGSFVFLTFSIMVSAELLVGLFETEIVNWYHNLQQNEDSALNIKLSFFHPVIVGSTLLFFSLYYFKKLNDLKIQQLIYENSEIENEMVEDEVSLEKYKELYKSIEHCFEVEKPYLDPKFSISQLSTQLNINTVYIAKAIKLAQNMNFKTYVSKYRIEETKKMIRQNDGRYTLEHIYTSCGFASQSTFNKVFRLIEGITPSDFQETEIKK